MKFIAIFMQNGKLADFDNESRIRCIDPKCRLAEFDIGIIFNLVSDWPQYIETVEEDPSSVWAVEIPSSLVDELGEEFLTHLRILARVGVKCLVWENGQYAEYWAESGDFVRARKPDFGEINSALRE